MASQRSGEAVKTYKRSPTPNQVRGRMASYYYGYGETNHKRIGKRESTHSQALHLASGLRRYLKGKHFSDEAIRTCPLGAEEGHSAVLRSDLQMTGL